MPAKRGRDTEVRAARQRWGPLSPVAVHSLKALIDTHHLSVRSGDILQLDGHWYVTHAGLLRVAARSRCVGIWVQPVSRFCNPHAHRWAFKAIVYKTAGCKGFVGFGDADPSNISLLVRGAEMRVAETRAVNRALRKAYGIGICSIEEIGAFAKPVEQAEDLRKLPPQPANGSGTPKLRDQLCLLIRQHRLDASLVKQYAAEFCGAGDLRQANRDQIQSFITHLAEFAKGDRESLLCKLNSFVQKPAGAA